MSVLEVSSAVLRSRNSLSFRARASLLFLRHWVHYILSKVCDERAVFGRKRKVRKDESCKEKFVDVKGAELKSPTREENSPT